MNTPITIRTFKSDDLPKLITLFQEAVAAINIRHYSVDQVAVWTHVDQEK